MSLLGRITSIQSAEPITENSAAMQPYKVFTSNKLKIIAAIAMFFDHFVTVFLPHNEMLSLVFRFFGRMAAPIYCFFIAEGFNFTSNLKKYISRLCILAIIAHLPYNLCFGFSFFQATSVALPLAMGLIALAVVKNEKIIGIARLGIVALCCAISYRANWNYVAVLWILAFGIFHRNLKPQIISFCAIGVVFHLIPAFIRFGFFHERFPQWFQLGIFLSIPFFIMFSGKQGKKSAFMSSFFYVFYPGHLILLYLLKHFTPLAGILGGLLLKRPG